MTEEHSTPLEDMRTALEDMRREAMPSDVVREVETLVERAEALSARDAQFQREADQLVANTEAARAALARSPSRQAQIRTQQLDTRLRAHDKAWKTHRRSMHRLDRQAARRLAAAWRG